MPKMFIISGCNGSGKTTASYSLLPEMLNCHEFVNSDEFAKSISPFDPSSAAVGASRFMVQKIAYLLNGNYDFAVETTLATRSLTGIIRQAKSLGYSVTILYFCLETPELAISRVKRRVEAGGHNISEETIRRRYKLGLKYFFGSYKDLCDRWALVDNTQTPFCVIAEGSSTETIIRNKKKYEQLKENLNDTQ